jgi:SAM-dependent methyltransferase
MSLEEMLSSLDLWHARLLKHADGSYDAALPLLPPTDIQAQFVGSALRPAFEEAYLFYSTFMQYSDALGMPFGQPAASFLDFGCGWGRFLRYAMCHFSQEQLFAADIDRTIVDTCIETRIPAKYAVIEPMGRLPYADNFFSHAMAYSVFTHLPEVVHHNWSAEIIRVLKPGGIFCGTIETRKFLEFIATMPDQEDCDTVWYQTLSTYKRQVPDLLANYDAGHFTYLPTGGGGVRTPDVYGEAVIPPTFIEKNWRGASLRAVLDDNFWQTVIIVQKN